MCHMQRRSHGEGIHVEMKLFLFVKPPLLISKPVRENLILVLILLPKRVCTLINDGSCCIYTKLGLGRQVAFFRRFHC